jgi:hypothetical protein
VHLAAGLAQLVDQRLVPIALEHDHRDLARPPALGLRDARDVLAWRRVDVDDANRLGTGGDLVHVDGGTGEEHRPALGESDHRNRVRLALRRQAGPLERVDRDIHRRAVAVADLLAVEEHRRLVLLALADHDDALHRDGVEDRAHAVDRGLVGGLLVAPADPPARAERGGLRHPDELEREVAVRAVPGTSLLDGRLSHRPRSYIRSGASTPTRSRQRAITVCVATQSPSRNASASLSSTRWWW